MSHDSNTPTRTVTHELVQGQPLEETPLYQAARSTAEEGGVLHVTTKPDTSASWIAHGGVVAAGVDWYVVHCPFLNDVEWDLRTSYERSLASRPSGRNVLILDEFEKARPHLREDLARFAQRKDVQAVVVITRTQS